MRFAVVDWFADAGRPALNGTPVPEPPDDAVRDALTWVLEGDPFYSLLRGARSARTDEDRDEVYRVIDDFVERHGALERPLDPALVRSALLAGDDLPDGAGTPDELRSATIQLTAATAWGMDELGSDLYFAVFARLFSAETISADSLAELFESPSGGANLKAAMRAIASHDPVEAVRRATADELRAARTVSGLLNGFGAFYFFHALQMPDTPGLARLRAEIDALGMRDLLLMRAAHALRTRGYATGVVSCLDRSMANLAGHLLRLVQEGPHLLGRPDTEHDAHAYMAEWISAVEGLRRA
ncbi:hypothetical protein [Amycolatopsis sp. cmx-4-83]|uniref:hypothetical protein n=1 Tax=Amycolatopsis sp. cmx-4-83 TaxID=2790940 RepID=UPI00397E05D3